MGKLTAAGVKAISKKGRYGDGNGLYLNVTDTGTKSWVQRITIDGRRRDLGLGSASIVSLATARNLAHDNRVAVADGRDPLAEKHDEEDVPTFREMALEVYEANEPRWSERHAKGWLRTLEKHVMPKLGDKRVNQIQQRDVLRILKPIWSEIPETARRVRQRIRTVLRWCQAHEYVTHNVAGEAIDGALPPMPDTVTHYRSLPYTEVADALKVVDASDASDASKLCFRFLVLTAARPSEALGARWSEIDLKRREWCLPPERMKARKEHRVPLSDGAMTVLYAAMKLRDGGEYVFPSPIRPRCPLSNVTLLKLLKDHNLGEQTTVHGFRSSFRTWALEQTNASWAVSEAALAHLLGNKVEQAYLRGDLFEQRKELMQEWWEYLR